jgi:predicted small integral membrane protein
MDKLKGVIALLVVAGAIYVAWNMVPPYFNNYQFQDDVDDVARRFSYLNKTEDDIREAVIKKATSDNITLREEQITITRGTDGIGITVRYRVHVDMIMFPRDVDFTVISYNKRI